VATQPEGPQKDRFTSLDALALAREVRALGRAHVDKIFDAGVEAFGVSLRAAGSGRRELLLVLGRYGAMLDRGVEHAEEPGPLAREMRRLLSGSIISDVPDPAGERNLEMILTRPDSAEPLRLAVEFFGTGNLIVARGDRIVAVAHPKAWAHRTVRIGSDYRPPPTRGNPWARTVSELEAALGSSRTDRASTLAARLGFGGPIAEELLVRAELSGAAPAPTEAREAAPRLHRALSELLAELGDRPRGYLYRRDGVLFDVEPFRSQRWTAAGAEMESTESFSEAAHRYFTSLAPKEPSTPPDPMDAARAELLRHRAQQEQAVAALAAEADQRNREADAIYAHYTEAETIRSEAERSQAADDKIEATLGEVRVPIWIRRPLDASARALYEEAKRAQSKLAGARGAIEETDRKLGEVVSRPVPATLAPGAEPTARKPHWFERYRWFLSSEGILVIGGRDAASNDLIVRRYLKSKDLYVHADIHGAPSVIVKHPETGASAGPVTLAEAGQFSVAFSKAWRAGLASTSAFWVTSEQVSKAAASGEFVARGAWVIHGTKNVLRDLPTELGVGTVEYQGAELWCAAPPSALRARGRVRVRIVPGEERERPEVEISLSSELGISRSRLQALLPAGGVKVLRT